jgi:uncharacterized membrane protein
MGRWLEHSVTTEIQAPVEQVWDVWSDLEAMAREESLHPAAFCR